MPFDPLKPTTLGEQFKVVDRLGRNYWSGADVAVFIEGVYVHEALQFTYQFLEQTRPYYGYADHVARRVHHGTRLINGELTLNYTRESYMLALLEYIRRRGESNTGVSRQFNNADLPVVFGPEYEGTGYTVGETQKTVADGVGNFDQNQPLTTEEQVIAQLQHVKSYKKMKREGQQLALQQAQETHKAKVYNTQGMFETFKTGFNMLVVFGGEIREHLTLTALDSASDNYLTSQQIFSTPGYKPMSGFELNGVSFMGKANQIDDSGRPIAETYTFMARNMRSVSTQELLGQAGLPDDAAQPEDEGTSFAPSSDDTPEIDRSQAGGLK